MIRRSQTTKPYVRKLLREITIPSIKECSEYDEPLVYLNWRPIQRDNKVGASRLMWNVSHFSPKMYEFPDDFFKKRDACMATSEPKSYLYEIPLLEIYKIQNGCHFCLSVISLVVIVLSYQTSMSKNDKCMKDCWLKFKMAAHIAYYGDMRKNST